MLCGLSAVVNLFLFFILSSILLYFKLHPQDASAHQPFLPHAKTASAVLPPGLLDQLVYFSVCRWKFENKIDCLSNLEQNFASWVIPVSAAFCNPFSSLFKNWYWKNNTLIQIISQDAARFSNIVVLGTLLLFCSFVLLKALSKTQCDMLVSQARS